jgi:spermidine/putrescine transport system permease protein
VCLLIGYPAAYIINDKRLNFNSNYAYLLLLPMWLNMLLRTYAWLVLLDKNGVINCFLEAFNLPKMNMLYKTQTIIIGIVYDLLPFMILSISNALKKIDYSLIEAAQDLGANNFIIFRKIILPLSLPGIFSGITMVFVPSMTTFIVPNILGSGKLMFIGNLIELEFLKVNNWYFGSALSIMLIIISLSISLLLSIISRYVFKIVKDTKGI